MAEELTFARKASGLVRGLSLFDAFGLGLLLVQPIYVIWYVVEVGLTLFPGANLIIAIVVSLLLGGISGPIVWGVLGGSMPRSGGEYVYNSRIINPAIAMGASFCQAAAVLYWNFFIATWVAVPALQILGQYMGWFGFADWISTKTGTYIASATCVVVAFLLLAFGMRIYAKIQRPLVVIGFGGPIILGLVMLVVSHGSFVNNWNQLATKYQSIPYDRFAGAVGDAIGSPLPTTWNWTDSIGAMTGALMMIIYLYTVAYVGGEVKRPDKTIIKSNYLIILVPVTIALVSVAALYKLVDFNFLSAAAYNDYSGGIEGYKFPFSTSYMSLVFIASGMNRVIGIIAGVTFLLNSLALVAIDILIIQRTMFAWGMDRMGPKWFTSVSGRWATPMYNLLVAAGLTMFGLIAYVWLFPSILTGLVGAGMQIVSVFLVTGIAALIFPYRKKVSGVWQASPFSQWKVGGIPVITIAAAVYIFYMLILFYYAFISPSTRDVTGKNLLLFAVVWIVGMVWYFAWRLRSSRQGVDTTVTYGELPPE